MKQVLRRVWQQMSKRAMATLGLVKFVRVTKLLKPVSHVLSCFLFFAEAFCKVNKKRYKALFYKRDSSTV